LRLIDTKQNRAIAQKIASQIQFDLITNQLDTTLDKYRLERNKPAKANCKGLITVKDYWLAYCNAKHSLWKDNTRRKHAERFSILSKAIKVDRVRFADLNAIKINDAISKVSKQNRAIMETLSAIHSWAIKSGLLETSPNRFKAILSDLPKHNWQQSPVAKAFTQEHQKAIIDWFDKNANQYLDFIRFLFLTGCRPSEAVGLTWEQVHIDNTNNYGYILFDRSISFRGGIAIYNHGSKNNKIRKFPINFELYILLTTHPRISNHPYVFTATGRNFDKGIKAHVHLPTLIKSYWKPCMKSLGLDWELYCCRDTFITNQIRSKVPIAVIAAWCDTSIRQIESRYLDKQIALDFTPV
jgi:integrase